MLRLALFEPDIAQNAGSILRLGACFGVSVDIIEPCGFVWSDRGLKRVSMDYLEHVDCVRHRDWASFCDFCDVGGRRLVLLTTRGSVLHYDVEFGISDTLLLGRESCGVPDFVHAVVSERVRIPMLSGVRSLNLATSAAVVISEALRQTGYDGLI